MTKFFCDYCGVHLTHDSYKGRKQHMYGFKHREKVKEHYVKVAKTELKDGPAILAGAAAGGPAGGPFAVRGVTHAQWVRMKELLLRLCARKAAHLAAVLTATGACALFFVCVCVCACVRASCVLCECM
jgi:hypothetical protein